ncbi:MAG: DNA repair protein RadA [Bacteroidia bacterium]|jgi:DNA repair protein RadA/Sms|nr:DNA repair protein RadA [Bacteroidia bacterium]MCC6767756.1 DNA repair protein RadA [Bacteroidia bacterium]
MAKDKTVFFCQSCGYQSPKWLGNCPSCNSWNSFVEERQVKAKASSWQQTGTRVSQAKPVLLQEVKQQQESRSGSGDQEFDRILGGGIVPGSLILLGGEPGIGKSTLMLQIAARSNGMRVLYVSGEESEQQIRMRADRIGIKNDQCFVLAETNLTRIFQHLGDIQPALLVVDSIQTLQTESVESSPGSVSQIRECTADLLRFAKESGTPVVLIGHITKDGQIAGPKILEHMVDVVLQFEGDRNHVYRLVRSVKNRFGSTAEIAIYQMQGEGLQEVENPSQVLLSHFDEPFSGIAISSVMEGVRPLMIESQALVSTAVYGTPQRSSTGFDLRRLNMLLAVIEKRCGFRLGQKDVFLNITGGIKVEDPAADLGVICAILSSGEDIPIPDKTCFAAEVGLSGEIRPVSRIEQRIAEAARLGYQQILVSAYGMKGLQKDKYPIRIIPIKKIEEGFTTLFG